MPERMGVDEDRGSSSGNRRTSAATVSAFLPEPFPIASRGANARSHYHDAFGDDDSGVDYGPPNECEDDEDEDEDDGNGEEEEVGDVPGDEGGSGRRPPSFGGMIPAVGEGERGATGDDAEYDDGGDGDGVSSTQGNALPAATSYPNDGPPIDDDVAHRALISIEELEEEAEMRESTLESLASKLSRLSDEISAEYLIASDLKHEISEYEDRMTTHERRRDENQRLVKVLEKSLTRCTERLMRALDARGVDDDDDDDDRDDDNDDDHRGPVSDGPEAVSAGTTGDEWSSVLRDYDDVLSDTIPESSTIEFEAEEGTRDRGGINIDERKRIEDGISRVEEYIHVDMPLDHKFDERGKIHWPGKELVEEVHRDVRTLRFIYPTWRTCQLSTSFLGGIDSTDLIYDAMNVAVLENLLAKDNERLRHSGGGTIMSPGDCCGGWVDAVDVWGTTLDVYAQVEWKHLLTCLRREDDVGDGTEGHRIDPSFADAKNSISIDPNVVICPYELGGTCADDQCPYQHLREYDDDNGNSKMRPIASNSRNREGGIRYNDFSWLKLPGFFLGSDVIFETETGCAKVDDKALLHHTRSNHSMMGDRQNLQDECVASYHENVDSSGDSPQNHDILNNLDYVSLPVVKANSADTDSDSDSGHIPVCKKSIFHGTFWWEKVGSSVVMEGSQQDCFDSILLAFGFQRLCASPNNETACSLRFIKRSTSINRRDEYVLLLSQLIDLSRVLVHMGRDSVALSALSSVCQSRLDDAHSALIEGASRSIRSLSHGRCCFYLFEVQVHLLAVSESLRCAYQNSNIDHIELLNQTVSDYRHFDSKLENVTLCGLKPGTMKTILQELNLFLFPSGFDVSCDNLVSRIPSTNHGCEDEWADFGKALRLMTEKFVITPYNHLGPDEQLTFLFHSIAIGKFWGHIVRLASMGHRFVPYLHVLEPIWTSLQNLLKPSLGRKRWLRPQIIAVVLIGPVIFGCVADMIAPQGMCATSSKFPPMFDARALANLSFLDKCIVVILKELNRFVSRGNGRLIESLLAPLHALSASICIAQGSFDKAHGRIEGILNKEVGLGDWKLPSIYALSEMIWSQLVQIRMICPSSSAPLNRSNSSGPSLPDDILRFHHEIASQIVGNGIVLWGLKLRGDCHMNIMSPCIKARHRSEWKRAVSQIFADRPVNAGDGKTRHEPSMLEFIICNPYPDFDEMKDSVAVFPESLLLLASKLMKLTLKHCGLTTLPHSIGYHLTNLQSLNLSFNHLTDLPPSICGMEKLEVLNLSHNQLKTFPDTLSRCISLRVLDVTLNQLTSFPPDLALQCSNLQSFLVDGNPAASSILHQPASATFNQPEKTGRRKKEKAEPVCDGHGVKPIERNHKRVRK